MKRALEVAYALGKRFEGLSLVPYLCPAKVPTIGRGTVYKPDGSKVTMQDAPITVKTADEWLNIALQRDCLPAAIKYTPALVGDQESIGAITDFIYNLGASRYKTSTLRHRLNTKNWSEAQYEINRWTRANGRVLRGLELRRAAEAELLP